MSFIPFWWPTSTGGGDDKPGPLGPSGYPPQGGDGGAPPGWEPGDIPYAPKDPPETGGPTGGGGGGTVAGGGIPWVDIPLDGEGWGDEENWPDIFLHPEVPMEDTGDTGAPSEEDTEPSPFVPETDIGDSD